MSGLEALIARSRGLTAHLFTRAELEALCTRDEAQLPRALAASGKLHATPAEKAGAAELELAVQQTVAAHLTTLWRWQGAPEILEVFEAASDLKSLRALVRGAVQGAAAAARLRGLLPTRTLPAKLLELLAQQPTPQRVAAHLVATAHPDAARLAQLTAKAAKTDLLAIDLALVHGFARRASRAGRRGDEALARFVAAELDLANATVALALAVATDAEPQRFFVPGGAALREADFVAAARAGSVTAAASVLARTALAPLVRRGGAQTATAASLEAAARAERLERLAREARLEPLGSAPVLLFLCRLDAMAADLRRIAHGAAMGVPQPLQVPSLVTR